VDKPESAWPRCLRITAISRALTQLIASAFGVGDGDRQSWCWPVAGYAERPNGTDNHRPQRLMAAHVMRFRRATSTSRTAACAFISLIEAPGEEWKDVYGS